MGNWQGHWGPMTVPIAKPETVPETGLASPGFLLPHEHRHPFLGLRFRPGTGPYPVSERDPSVAQCLRHFGPTEYGVWGLTAAVPATFGYYHGRTFRDGFFLLGLGLGAGTGLVYAYVRAYCTAARPDWLMAVCRQAHRSHAAQPTLAPE